MGVQIVDVVTHIMLFISLPKLVTKTNDTLFYSLPLVMIGCQWRKKRMRRYAEKFPVQEGGSGARLG